MMPSPYIAGMERCYAETRRSFELSPASLAHLLKLQACNLRERLKQKVEGFLRNTSDLHTHGYEGVYANLCTHASVTHRSTHMTMYTYIYTRIQNP